MPTATLRIALSRGTTLPDGDLLDRFRTARDADAFEALVVRHGPSVLGVCRRVLRDRHAADDAFQATFLVLARKAAAIRPPELVGAWLYGVAYRTALKARCRDARRTVVERAASAQRREAVLPVPPPDADFHAIIDEQVAALPEKYRLPVILCVVQGASKADAATRLGLNEGTLSSRLARGRDMLRNRLERRGVSPAVALAVGGVVVSSEAVAATAEAGVSFAVGAGAAVSPAVLSLTHEVLRSMNPFTLKLLGVVTAVAVAVGGIGFAAGDGKDVPKPKAEAKAKPKAVVRDGEKPKPKDGDKPKPGEDDKPKKPDGDGKRIVGTIAEVNETAKAINVVRKGDGGETKTLVGITAETKVFVNGKEAKLSAIPKNALAEVTFKPAADPNALPTATEIRIAGKDRRLLLDKIDGKDLFFKTEGASRSLPLADGVTVVIAGAEAKLTDLKSGDAVTATLTADDAAVLKIVVKKRAGGDNEKEKDKQDQ